MKKYLWLIIIIEFCLGLDVSLAAEADGPVALSSVKLNRTGQIATYDENGGKIDFSGSGQDGEYQRGSIWPEPRFFHNGDGTITDNLTGLVWLKDGQCLGEMNWHSAVKIVDNFNKSAESYGCRNYAVSYDDWRLPDLAELESLVNYEDEVVADYLKLSGFSDVQERGYWSQTSYVNPFNAWQVDMHDGSVYYRGKMSKSFVLLVRTNRVDKQKLSDSQRSEEEPLAVIPTENVDVGSAIRFVDNGDGTVSDLESGLMWLKDAACFSEISWLEALAGIEKFGSQSNGQCAEYNAIYDDWTMPNRNELKTLVDLGKDFPALPTHPFAKLSRKYWSSTSKANNPSQAFVVDMFDGSLTGLNKNEKIAAWPVRYIVPVQAPERLTTHAGLGIEVEEKYVIRADPSLPTELQWPPEPRFFDNGDGTIMDRMTGYTWLADASCFGKMSWTEALNTIDIFNKSPGKFNCKGYEVAFGDWIIPSIEELGELVNPNEKNSYEWLSRQGVVNIQSGSDYWSSTPTLINLYYAYVINFKKGEVRNYPQSLKFFYWPRRSQIEDSATEEPEPILNITANAVSDAVSVKDSEAISISIYLYSFGIRKAADFWFWYETPTGETIWLSPIRTWKSAMLPIYQGELFNLKNYEIFRSNKSEKLTKGIYTFHFGIDFNQDGVLDDNRFENKVVVTVE